VDYATHTDLVAAGFERPEVCEDRPGQQPLDEMLVEGRQTLAPDVASQVFRQLKVPVLRDATGQLVATWDEGRWWTPAESAEYLRRLVAQMRADAGS
jgi:hypothetical protein